MFDNIILGILEGSPWALVALATYASWRLREEFKKTLAQKDAKIEAKQQECLRITNEGAVRLAEAVERAHQEQTELQERRINDLLEAQKETNQAMNSLNNSLQVLIETIRQRRD